MMPPRKIKIILVNLLVKISPILNSSSLITDSTLNKPNVSNLVINNLHGLNTNKLQDQGNSMSQSQQIIKDFIQLKMMSM